MEDNSSFIPFRLCCGQQHIGVQCPDGKVMCCLCFDRFSYSDLSVNEDGDKTDVCLECRNWEQERLNKRERG